jgi:probable DNA repair protein
VLGLDDASWPSAPNPNPFIPARLQDEVGIARVSADAELSWAERHAAAWATSAQNVTFSYAMSDGDAVLRPSRALPGSETALAADTLDDPHLAARAHPFMLRGKVELEPYADERGSVLPAGSVLRDGVGVLRDQALCPFRAWAIHRLGTRDQRAPHSLPDAIDRGNLVHDALGAVCDAYPSQAALNEVEIGDVEEIVLNVVSRSGARWPATFRRHEVVRITRLLSAWLDVERRRRPFRIESIEDAHSMSIEGLNLNVRVDRVDVLQGGGRVVIDIKTGKASTANWQLPRPREPQLPLYSLLFDEVAAVAFAEINAQHVRMIGVGDGARLGLEIDQATRFDARDIEDLRSRWRAALTSIAREVRDGIAPAAPVAASVCRACHLHSLCRIFEQP